MSTPTPGAATTPTTGDVRLRRPDQTQATMRFGRDDDLIPAGH